MDHPGFDEWPADDHDFGDAETADLGDHDDLLAHHLDPLVPDDDGDLWPHEGYETPDEIADAHHEYAPVDAHVDEPLDHPDGPGGGDDPAGSTPTDHQPLGYEAAGAQFGHADAAHPDPVFGADPDAPGEHGDDGFGSPEFPPPVDLGDLPAPVDGPPWTDATLLGGEPLADLAPPTGLPSPADLLGYAGLDVEQADPWAALRAVEDPAANALARWWGPAG
jgi:hypothetical protein